MLGGNLSARRLLTEILRRQIARRHWKLVTLVFVALALFLSGLLAQIWVVQLAGVAGIVGGILGIGYRAWPLLSLLITQSSWDRGDPTARLWNLLVEQGVAINAQEMRISGGGSVQVFVNGTWKELLRLPTVVRTPVMSRIRSIATADVGSEGQIRIAIRGRDSLLRVSFEMGTNGTEEVRVRFLQAS